MTAPVELVRELLYYRDMRFANYRDWGMVTAFIAGSSLAMPMLAPFAIGSLIAFGVQKARSLMHKRAIVGIQMPAAAAAPGSTTLYGIARRFQSTVTSILDGAQVLVEHAMVKDRDGAVLIRRSTAAPFLLDVEGVGPVLVTGVARVTSPIVLARRLAVRRDDPHLGKMGVPADLGVAGDLEVASVAADGANLAVTGVIEEEAVVELAFHRDGGRIPVMRGRVGAPVLVEDRRLIAAAL
ncbi:MAG: hypothetical protein SFX73_31060 [Kofleriaceae bacterium]|nr:hypothetical protein [Kofleriaceae bacterium]